MLYASGTLAVIGTAGLALDLGVAYLAKTRLHNALDAAALSGAKTLLDTFDEESAKAAALQTFALNQNSLPAGLVPMIETSPTLVPFASGAPNPVFVKVSLSGMSLPIIFARVLPGVGDALSIGGAAVAGPIPVGGDICGSVPIAICGTPGDSDCTDGECFGLGGGPTGEMEIKGRNSNIGPGNYGLVSLDCGPGGACVREGMAGGSKVCFNDGGTVTTQPGLASGPARQGLNTRFGIYRGPVSAAEYPSDVVTTSGPGVSYAVYKTLLANPAAWDRPQGVPQRRVVPVPVMDCTTPVNGRSRVPVLGAACLFLTRPVEQGDNTIYGEFVATCRADGGVAEVPAAAGPSRVVLYQDPDAAA